jgi:hypothetical protein
VKRAGDVIYVPHGWGHGVLNLEASVGWATSFTGEHMAFATPPYAYRVGGEARTATRVPAD